MPSRAYRILVWRLFALLLISRVAIAQIPAGKFFGDPAISAVAISPDGRHVAFKAPIGKHLGIALMDLETGRVEPLVSAVDENIDEFIWKSNDMIVYLADVGGNEAEAVQSIHIKTRRITRLLESMGRNNLFRTGGHLGSVLTYWPTNPKKIIVYGNRERNGWSGGVYEVDIATAKRSEIGGFTDDKESHGVYFDHNGLIRLQLLDTEKEIMVRARLGDDLKFTPLMMLPRDLLLARLAEATILADNRTLLFVDYSKHDRGAVVAWDLVAGRQSAELFVPPEGEVTDLVFDRDHRKLVGVRYEAERSKTVWFDDELVAVQTAVDEAFPETINRLTDWSDDRKKILVAAFSDIESSVNFILDRSRPQPKLMPLGSARPDLDSKSLAHMEPVKFKVRDGLELHGYLTRPVGSSAPFPLIINPHGGPYGIRDRWGYNGEVQFLANRGYAVLQVNYRGSGGYGRKFLEAGRLEWGKKMQDDLTDAVQWAVAQGLADPKRVAIYGASYGGYAALAGATFTPGIYRCAINYVGVADLTYLGRRDQGGDRFINEIFYKAWIHPDMEELRRRSPANFVSAITIPVLHAYGENDPRVEWRQWKKLKAELDKHRVTYEIVGQEDEGHGFSNAGSRVGFYLKLEDFLARNMKP